jgi:DNA-binding HxlR family transcriptional regulator
MLTLTLRGLECDGFVERTVMASLPPHVSYGLTDLRKSLCEPARALCAWSKANIGAVSAARERFRESATSATNE